MSNHLKTKLGAEWHRLVTGSEHDMRHVLEWLLTELEKEFDMATLETISEQLTALPSAVATAVVAALPAAQPIDTTVITTAIRDGFAALTAEIKTNVEGAAPAPTA